MSHRPAARIALFLPSLRGGGAERVMVNLANGFVHGDHEVDLVLVQATGPYRREVCEEVRVVDLKASRTATALPKLARYLRRERPDVMLSTLNHANLIALTANLLAGQPTRVLVREANTMSVSTRRAAALRARAVPFLAQRLYSKSAGVIAVSQGVAEDLVGRQWVKPEQVEVIYNPSITPDIQELAQEPVDHPFYQDRCSVVLGVGSLTAQKDFPTLIRAFSRVWIATGDDRLRLVILGKGALRDELEGLVASLGLEGKVDLPGFVDNPFAFMGQAKAYVLSSAWEGLPNTLLQAMGTGVPVIATDCPSGPSEILEDGRWGQLIPVGDVEAMAEAIKAVTHGQWEQPTQTSHLRRFQHAEVVEHYRRFMLNERGGQ